MRKRPLALAALAFAQYGALAATGGYAWYLRSDAFRARCAAALSESLQLPAEIAGIVPRSLAAREFTDVSVWLPQRRDRAFLGRRAILAYKPAPDDPDAYELELIGGRAEISARTWLREDYRGVVESGLRPGFGPGGPRRVSLAEMDVIFGREGFELGLHNASGTIWFEPAPAPRGPTLSAPPTHPRPAAPERIGHAMLACHDLNGQLSLNPVVVTATFSSDERGVQIDRLALNVPRTPLAVLGLGKLLGHPLQSGAFQGALAYGERADGGRRLSASGTCFDVALREWTAALLGRAWRGECPELALDELVIEDGAPQRLSFHGALRNLYLADLLEPWGFGDLGGQTRLWVRQATLSPAGIENLIAAAECQNLSLERVAAGLGWGPAGGTLQISVTDLTIEANQLVSLEARLAVEPAQPGQNWVSGTLVREIVARLANLPLPPVLPERIEFTQFGVRLDAQGERLHVFGTHGPRDNHVLTLRLMGSDWPIPEPQQAIDLTPWADQVRAVLLPRWTARLAALRRAPASAPAAPERRP